MLADIRESLGHGGDIYRLCAVPVKKAVLGGELSLGPIKIIFMQDKRAGEDVAQQPGERRLAARRAA